MQGTFLTLAPNEMLPILMLQIKMTYTIVIYLLRKNKVKSNVYPTEGCESPEEK
jgi:hypothetical protein